MELWMGPFGDQYQERNQIIIEEIENRMGFWELVFKSLYVNTGREIKSILEIGAGKGPNIIAIEKVSTKYELPMQLFATEINAKARIALQENCKTLTILDDIPDQPIADLVFTYGVMIHTHPAHIKQLQTRMYNASNRFLMCVEYFAPTTEMIPYRGETDALWRDDYGSHFLRNCSLRVIRYGFAWKRMSGLDNLTYFLFEKTKKMQ